MLYLKDVRIAKTNRVQTGGQDADLWDGGLDMCIFVEKTIWDYINIYSRSFLREPATSAFSSSKHLSAFAAGTLSHYSSQRLVILYLVT